MTCHAIYWQKARTNSKGIDGSARLTAGSQPAVYANGLTVKTVDSFVTKRDVNIIL
jgi:hypothetical protein